MNFFKKIHSLIIKKSLNEAIKRRGQLKLSPQFKQEIIDLYLSQKFSNNEIIKIKKISSKTFYLLLNDYRLNDYRFRKNLIKK